MGANSKPTYYWPEKMDKGILRATRKFFKSVYGFNCNKLKDREIHEWISLYFNAGNRRVNFGRNDFFMVLHMLKLLQQSPWRKSY